VPEKFSSFEVRAGSLTRLLSKVREHAREHRGRLGFLTLTTEAADAARTIASALAAAGGTWIVTVAPGVLSERGEIEGAPAAVGLVLPGVQATPVLETAGLSQFGQDVAREIKGGRGALLLCPADGQTQSWVSSLRGQLGAGEGRVIGAGTPPGHDHYLVHEGHVRSARSLAVALDRSWLPHVTSSAGCRLLSPLLAVTKTRGRTVLEFEGIPALAALSQCAGNLEDAPLILLALAVGDEPLSADGRKLALWPIVGVDPGRGGIDIADEVPVGTRIAFAVRDGHAARTDLDAHLRTLRQSCRGGAPAFGIYVSGSGRGRRLYDTDDVDVRLIRAQFPDMPLIGFQSVFEISAIEGRLTSQVQSGVLGVFCAPS